jgi:hypothetical protein
MGRDAEEGAVSSLAEMVSRAIHPTVTDFLPFRLELKSHLRGGYRGKAARRQAFYWSRRANRIGTRWLREMIEPEWAKFSPAFEECVMDMVCYGHGAVTVTTART